jgi:hypothetical protein
VNIPGAARGTDLAWGNRMQIGTRISRIALSWALLVVATFAHPLGAAARGPLGAGSVRRAVLDYARQRGFRPRLVGVELRSVSRSGKSTRALVRMGGREVAVAINHQDRRLQAGDTAALTAALLEAHVPYARTLTGEGSRFANMLVDFQPGEGATHKGIRPQTAPLGRPRAGASPANALLDALVLGGGGGVTVALGRDVLADRPGAAIRVRENGVPDGGGQIINQTPGLVEVMVGSRWHRLGYAGYLAGGDTLLLRDAIDPIPSGASISVVRVTDAPNGPHPRGWDPTDNAVAAARGVKGFDLVSIEGVAGAAARRSR